jgi:hypothetical protein
MPGPMMIDTSYWSILTSCTTTLSAFLASVIEASSPPICRMLRPLAGV